MNSGRNHFFLFVVVWLATLTLYSFAQTESATVSGRITDQQGAVLPTAEVTITNVDTNVTFRQTTNRDGRYVLTGLKPGHYRMTVTSAGFRTVNVSDIVLNVQDAISQNFNLQVGSVSESVTVVADEARVNTESATVSTVVDRNFAENLPMNGRSFQTLIQLTPGVVVTASNFGDGGQFSVNGQRASANYFMVDGVSANIGIGNSTIPANGAGGALGAFSVQGGTNSLVSVDALQEFRIQTSTYAPEFGRAPGAQVSILTRSGTNQFHGTVFDYLRNDILDANDWFADNERLPKPEERQNDFGATLGGPILRDRTFFFFSYEGLRLRLPQVAQTTVPDLNARRAATSAMRPYLSAYPFPNGPEVLDNSGHPTGSAQFNASFSNQSTLDAYSIRFDHRVNNKLNLFGRYSYSPSDLGQRGDVCGCPLSVIDSSRIVMQTSTLGATWNVSNRTANEFRANYSRVNSSGRFSLDSFGGASPLTESALAFPEGLNTQNARLSFNIFSLADYSLGVGKTSSNVQRQVNIIDNISLQRGSHALRFGVDFRRLSPIFDPYRYQVGVSFPDVQSATLGQASFAAVSASTGSSLLFHNIGLFAQDTFRAISRFTVTYGVRWDVDVAPSSGSGPPLLAVRNFNDLSMLAPAAAGTPVFKTTYGNFAPRLGLAYELDQDQSSQTVIRAGFGVFYDLATAEAGEAVPPFLYPFGSIKFLPSGTNFPLDPQSAAPPQITPAFIGVNGLYAFDPNLKLPYSLEWNVAMERSLGTAQVASISYVGASGRRLIQTETIFQPNPSVPIAQLATNGGSSSYNGLQIQYRRKLSRGLQALASYSWAHSIDTGSASSNTLASNSFVPGLGDRLNRGPSDFDIRHSVSAAITYDVPAPHAKVLSDVVLRGWSLDNIIQARSAPPVTLFDSTFFQIDQGLIAVRPDVISGPPFYLYGSQFPGGKGFNRAAFTDPPTDASGNPIRQGTLGRNALRAFGAVQWDFAVHRTFPIHEELKLQFRAEMFNIINHPNFGPPVGDLSSPQFGRATQMLGRSLDSFNQGNGSFNPLYQIGGPRSIQFALKFLF